MNSDDLIRELQSVNILEKLSEGRTEIRNFNNILIGEFDETDDEIIVYDLSGCPRGRYTKRDNTTRQMSGAPIGYGNTVITLLHP